MIPSSSPSSFQLSTDTLRIELGRHLWGVQTRTDVIKTLESYGLLTKIKKLFEKENNLNNTEQKSVTHTLWRSPNSEFSDELKKVTNFADQLCLNDNGITDVVNVGIGGSHLGNELVCTALKNFQTGKIITHFLSGPDPEALSDLLNQLNPKTTLWLFVSKSFKTLETLTLLQKIKEWFFAAMPKDTFNKHFIAITNQLEIAYQQGFHSSQCFWFDEGVGGRFSIWSTAGLIILLALGKKNHSEFLAGAHAMDQHFLNTPISENIPVWLAWLDYFYTKFFHATSRVVEPYSQRLRLLPSYLQQLEMESLGKSAQQDGGTNELGLVLWGGVGPEAQHTFHQFLYQSQQLIPVEFIAIKKSTRFQELQKIQFAECLAQAKALWEGLPHKKESHKRIEPFKPSTVIVLEQLTPFTLGQLLAMYEHKVFVLGELYRVNVFDQFGVELGKTLTVPILEAFDNKKNFQGLDEITQALMKD